MDREYGTIKGMKHYVYRSMEDFENHQMKLNKIVPPVVKKWREAAKGDWTIADDGGIVQILRAGICKKTYNRYRPVGYVGTVVGTFVQKKAVIMDTDFSRRTYPIDRYRWPGARPIDTLQRVRERTKITKNERYFCVRVATGISPFEAYEEIYATKNKMRMIGKTHHLLSQDRIMTLIKQSIVDIAANLDKPVTHETNLVSLTDLRDKTKDDRIKFQIIERLCKIVGTTPTEGSRAEAFEAGRLFQGFKPKEIEEADVKVLPDGENGEHK